MVSLLLISSLSQPTIDLSRSCSPFDKPRTQEDRCVGRVRAVHETSKIAEAPGDFAEAYVLAHEIGHHVQTLTGTSAAVHREQQRQPSRANALSVRLELQADCFAGVWAAGAEADGLLETGDLEEGLNAAAAVGDDRLQRSATGTVQPESFTHGTSRERVSWFRRGFESGDPNSCDTL